MAVALIASTVGRTDTAAYIRGKLFMAGVGQRTPLGTALDVLQVLVMDVPVDEIRKWRRELDIALWKVTPPSRETWGLEPDQVVATERLIRGTPS